MTLDRTDLEVDPFRRQPGNTCAIGVDYERDVMNRKTKCLFFVRSKIHFDTDFGQESHTARLLRHLKGGARLCLEHGLDQAPAVRALFEQHAYVAIRTHRDTEQRDRVSEGVWVGGSSS